MSDNRQKETESGERESLSVRFNRLNEAFDKKTKELKIFRVLLSFILYFVFFLTFEAVFGFCETYVATGQADWLSFTHVSLTAAAMLSAFLWIMPKRVQAVLFPLSAVFWCVYATAELCVLKSNGSLFRITNVVTGKNAAEFAGSVISKMPKLIWVLLAILIAAAVAVEIIVIKKAEFKPIKPVRITKNAVGGVAAAVCAVVVLINVPGDSNSYKSYIYENFTDTNTVYGMSDFYTYFFHDIAASATAKTTAKKNVSKIDEFFEQKQEHTDNEMTGIFEGKNLLVIQLESFDSRLITEEICPNLTKIKSESLVFENYYGMRYGSEPTIGNEMAVDTGLYSTSDYTASGNSNADAFPYSLANMFKSAGYSADVYHENGASFYNRDKTEVVFGYDSYHSFRDMTDEDIVYEDDYVIAECDDIYEQIVGGDKFLSYVIGYSTHPPYIFGEKSSLGFDADERLAAAKSRHPELELDIDDEDSVYKCLAPLTDDMAGRLIERMEEDGTLDNTVILFIADHANLNTLENASGADYVKVQNLPCFIYAKGLEPQTVSRVCSNVDILPTLLNMFGIENSGYYIGNDIFDPNTNGIAYLSDFSWITDKCICINGSVAESFTDEEITDEYIKETTEEVKKRIEINNLILYSDYYSGSRNH